MLRHQLKSSKIEYFYFEPDYKISPSHDFTQTLSFRFKEDCSEIVILAKFEVANGGKRLLRFAISCSFVIHSEDIKDLITADKICLEKAFANSLISHVVGISRGVLLSKTKEELYDGIIMPLIDISNILPNEGIVLVKN